MDFLLLLIRKRLKNENFIPNLTFATNQLKQYSWCDVQPRKLFKMLKIRPDEFKPNYTRKILYHATQKKQLLQFFNNDQLVEILWIKTDSWNDPYDRLVVFNEKNFNCKNGLI